MEFSTSSATAFSGLDWERAMMVIAFQSLPIRSLPRLRERFGDSGFFDITLGLFASGKQIEILAKLKQTIPLEAGNLPKYPYLFEALSETACGGISNAELLTHLLSVHYRL
jgi:hypothetical protein